MFLHVIKSQKGASFDNLQPQIFIFFVDSSIVKRIGLNTVPLCESSQKGAF